MSHLFTDQSPCLFPLSCSLPYLFRHSGQHWEGVYLSLQKCVSNYRPFRHSFRWEIRKWLSLCCSSPLLIYLLLSVCMEVWCAASLTSGSSNRKIWSRLNSGSEKKERTNYDKHLENYECCGGGFTVHIHIMQELVAGSAVTEEEFLFQTQFVLCRIHRS